MLAIPLRSVLFRYNFNILRYRNLTAYFTSKHFPGNTIFALSTPPGISAIAVIRISGPYSSDVLYKMGRLQKLPPARKAIVCKIWDPESESLLDKAIVMWFPGPKSFTGEDMCELHIHGGRAVLKSVLNGLSKVTHLRLAEPGEFTKRAFMANKFDLTEVEGLSNLLHAETEAQQKQALRQMDGVLNKLYTQWSDKIKMCLASIEAFIDFSEDQQLDNSIPFHVEKCLSELRQEMCHHLSNTHREERLRNGVLTVLTGKPNVGKSSLLNNLCQRDIAIVSPTAGTTRDIIETSISLNGFLVHISDTAGLRKTEDFIEMEGVRRAKERALQADILLLIMDARSALEITKSKGLSNEGLFERFVTAEFADSFTESLSRREIDSHIRNKNIILLLNKMDLLNEGEKKKIMQIEKNCSHIFPISCTEGSGMEKFLILFSDVVKEMCSVAAGEESILIQERHRIHIKNCLRNITEFGEFDSNDIVIAAEKLRIAMNELGKITGKVRMNDIIDVIFRDFCIGK